MAQVATNGIELHVERRGAGEPLLLIMGLGGQIVDWPPELVNRLAERFEVIVFDNRDAGLSTLIEQAAPSALAIATSTPGRPRGRLTYTLDDMAADAAGLVARLGLGRVHVVGVSMGAMISQLLAINHPELVATLTSMNSTTGARDVGQPGAEILPLLRARLRPSRADAVEISSALFARCGGADWDADAHRQRTSAAVARSYRPEGVLRQAHAVAAAWNRTDRLRELQMPTTVIHGLDDRLVTPSGGVATAAAVPGSRLHLYPRMGHDLPRTRHTEIVEAICAGASMS